MPFDQALNHRITQRTSVENTGVPLFTDETLPLTPYPGQFVYNYTQNRFQIWDGGQWRVSIPAETTLFVRDADFKGSGKLTTVVQQPSKAIRTAPFTGKGTLSATASGEEINVPPPPPSFKAGYVSDVTNNLGDILVNHKLGAQPSSFMFMSVNTVGFFRIPADLIGPINAKVRCYGPEDHLLLDTAVTGYWVAFR